MYNAYTQTSTTSTALASCLEVNTVQLVAQNNLTLNRRTDTVLTGAGGGTASLSINASQTQADANFQALQNNFSEEQLQIAQESVQASQILGNVAPKLVESFAQGKLDDANNLEEQAARLE